MTPDECVAVVLREFGASVDTKVDQQDFLSWSDIGHGRRDLSHDGLAAAIELAGQDVLLLLSTWERCDATTIPPVAELLLGRVDDVERTRWMAVATSEALRQLVALLWLKDIASRWRRSPDATRVERLIQAMGAHLSDQDVWWEVLALTPSLEFDSHDPGLILHLHQRCLDVAGLMKRIPTRARMDVYRKSNRSIVGALPFVAQHLDDGGQASTLDVFWEYVKEDLVSSRELSPHDVNDQLYLEGVAIAVSGDDTRWKGLALAALTGGTWRRTASATHQSNAAWLLAAVSFAVIQEHERSSTIPQPLLDELWTLAAEHLELIFWEPAGGRESRAVFAGLLCRALALAGAFANVLTVANEVRDPAALDAIVERTRGLLPDATLSELTDARDRLAAFVASLGT